MAKMLRPTWTKNKLTKAVNALLIKPDAYGVPLQLFFTEEGIKSDEFKEILGSATAGICMDGSKTPRWACRRVLKDVLNGFLTIIRRKKRK